MFEFEVVGPLALGPNMCIDTPEAEGSQGQWHRVTQFWDKEEDKTAGESRHWQCFEQLTSALLRPLSSRLNEAVRFDKL